MSNQQVHEFLQKVTSDEQLQQELGQVLQSAKDDREAAVALAQKHGYIFSPDELWQEVKIRQGEFGTTTSNDELSDEELEAVAGGSQRHRPLSTLHDVDLKPKW